MEIKCIKLNDLTESICENNFKVRYMLPGETAEFINRKHKVIHEVDIRVASPHRAKVICPIFYECGGCDFLHIKYNEQLRLKEDYIHKLFQKCNIRTTIHPMIKNDEPLNYRHKVVATATTSKNKLRLGLYQESSKNIIPFLDCYIQDKELNEVLKTTEKVLNKYKMSAYDINKETGIIKHIMMRKSLANGQMLLVFVTNGYLLPNAKKMIQEIYAAHPKIMTFVQNVHLKKTHLVLLDEEKILSGTGYIEDEIDSIRFRLSSKSFYQVNPKQMMKLYQKAIELAQITKDDIVMDTYSGIGTISLIAAKSAKKVIAVETNQTAHQDAMFNKKNNGIANIYFYNDDVSNFMLNFNEKVDCLIMDPPRDGASESFLKAVMKMAPKKIVYISCEPETQIRDLMILKDAYRIKDIQPVDMFSNTEHLESIALLELSYSL